MVFELYGEHIEGIITRRLTYALAVVSVNEEVHHLEKLNIKYMYKREEMTQVVQDIEVDAGLKAQNLISLVHRSARFQVDDRVLVRCCKEKNSGALNSQRRGDYHRGDQVVQPV